jgi:serine/threonine protein kinase
MMPPAILTVEYLRNRKYVVAKELHGGMGTVYKLFPVAGGEKTVAMKTIKGKSSIQAFDIECEAWFSVAHHPNIARALAFGRWNSLPSVIIEWYPMSLDTLDRKVLSATELQRLIAGTLSALNFAYTEKALIHQDIKPANILIDKSGQPRLSDFGLARCVAATAKERIAFGTGNIPKSTSREVSGTPFFMAPELWGGSAPSIRSDIFSLGVTFYQMLTKEHPYVEPSPELIVQDQIRTAPLLASVAGKGDQGAQIVAFLTKCLALDPAHRYQSYAEIIRDHPWANSSRPDSGWTIDRSEIIAGTSQFFRAKGEVNKSFSALEGILARRPNDVVLIEELGNLHAAIGQGREAELHYSIAYNNLQLTKGLYEDRFFPRPALAWARCLIRSGRHKEAADIVKEVLDWSINLPQVPTGVRLIGAGLYAEIGWYLLYKGDFAQSAHDLATYSSRRSLNKEESVWIAEAAWLSGVIKSCADEIALKVMENKPDVTPSPGELEHVWARVILHQYANPLLQGQLWKGNPSYLFLETSNLEKASGATPGSLLMPKDLDKQRPFILAMDNFSTGGAHHAFIRSVSKI